MAGQFEWFEILSYLLYLQYFTIEVEGIPDFFCLTSREGLRHVAITRMVLLVCT